jgi:hypothetical protein
MVGGGVIFQHQYMYLNMCKLDNISYYSLSRLILHLYEILYQICIHKCYMYTVYI